VERPPRWLARAGSRKRVGGLDEADKAELALGGRERTPVPRSGMTFGQRHGEVRFGAMVSIMVACESACRDRYLLSTSMTLEHSAK
jgi:hypothetical protein